MGAGAVLKTVKESQSGAKHMEITSNTYWYVKKFLAHKIAFEEAVKGIGQIQVITYENRSKKELAVLAKEVSLTEADLQLYNKWAKKGTIPDDRTYMVLIPLIGDAKENKTFGTIADVRPTAQAQAQAKKIEILAKSHAVSEERIKINGISAVRAMEGENAARLATRTQADLSDFLKWNDISISDRILPGQYYLLGKKRVRASESYHKVIAGENLWQISQQHGVQLRKLKKYNKIDSDNDLKPDMMLWLTATKPKDGDQAVSVAEVVQVDNSQTFSWSVNPDQVDTPIDIKKISVDPKPETPIEAPTIAEMTKSSTFIDLEENINNAAQELDIIKAAEINNEHTVILGETLYGIAQQHQVSVMDIVTLNNLNLQEGIKPGQVLKITEQQETKTAIEQPRAASVPIEHEVKASDTLYSIARKYGVTIKEIMEWNAKKDFSVSVGEKLKVYPR
jgi:membrane-bound lytic murein transglycosylase D